MLRLHAPWLRGNPSHRRCQRAVPGMFKDKLHSLHHCLERNPLDPSAAHHPGLRKQTRIRPMWSRPISFAVGCLVNARATRFRDLCSIFIGPWSAVPTGSPSTVNPKFKGRKHRLNIDTLL